MQTNIYVVTCIILLIIVRNISYRFLEVCEELLEENEEEPALRRDLKHIPYQYDRLSAKESLARALEFYQLAAARRTLRFFSADPVPKEIIREVVRAAGIFYLLIQ